MRMEKDEISMCKNTVQICGSHCNSKPMTILLQTNWYVYNSSKYEENVPLKLAHPLQRGVGLAPKGPNMNRVHRRFGLQGQSDGQPVRKEVVWVHKKQQIRGKILV